MVINQWVPAAHRGDAIGDSARRVRNLLRAKGHESDLFAMTIDDDLRQDVRPLEDAASRRGEVTILHFALPSPMTGAFATLPGARVLQYHNITPAHFFAGYDAGMFRLATLGRRELATLVGHVDLALGDSDFNRRELEALGFAPTGVMPIAVDLGRITDAPARPALARVLEDGLINFLFVGRIAPNKRIEDHIRLAEHYKRYVDAYYRFIFVGKADAVPDYYRTIRALMAEYRMPADRFVFTGPVPDADLAGFLPACGRLRLAQRARRLLRPAAGVDGRGRPGPRVRRSRRARDDGRGGRRVQSQGSRAGGRVARGARLRSRRSPACDRRPAAAARGVRRRAHVA